jgi:LAO/AO transport system kinase
MSAPDKKKPTLSVSEGVDHPGSLNPDAVSRLRNAKKKQPDPTVLLDGILNGDIGMLSQAITLVESSLHQHEQQAQELVAACLPHAGNSFRLGITGVPGAGKSTFIEALGKHIIGLGKRLAVLAIDPSSERSKGSILGDKTRMEELAGFPEVYIRPSPSGGTLGGVARKTREAIILCEAAGFDTIFVETVGVGQSETTVHSMVDFFLLLMLAGSGDELQGIKRGIIEMADSIVINKSDGSNVDKARRAQTDFTNALHLFPPDPSGWIPRVLTCSSLEQTGIAEIWNLIEEFRTRFTENGVLFENRKEQRKYWLHETIREGIFDQVFKEREMFDELKRCEERISRGEMTSFAAATAILNKYKSKHKDA